jgi:IS1 family transposase
MVVSVFLPLSAEARDASAIPNVPKNSFSILVENVPVLDKSPEVNKKPSIVEIPLVLDLPRQNRALVLHLRNGRYYWGEEYAGNKFVRRWLFGSAHGCHYSGIPNECGSVALEKHGVSHAVLTRGHGDIWLKRFHPEPCPFLVDYQRDVLYGSFSTQLGGLSSISSLQCLPSDETKRQKRHDNQPPFGPFEGCVPTWRFVAGFCGLLTGFGVAVIAIRGQNRAMFFAGISVCGISTVIWLTGHEDCSDNTLKGYHQECTDPSPNHANTVTQKLLTTLGYCNTVLSIGRAHMANVLNTDKQIAVIGGLAEGSSIRSIERITGVHRDTIMRLGVRIGQGCSTLLDQKMRNLPCHHLQFDEIWGFIGKKERHCDIDDSPELGDVWTFCAIDPETKLVPSFKCGKRDLATANAFVSDVASRVRNRVQISSDALRAYVDAIEMNFGSDVDFAQIVKTYVTDDSHIPERRFSAPEIVITEKKAVTGFPDMRLASTSHVERLNGTTRLHMRRLTRLTYAFSKKLENFEAAVALHFAYYNFVKRHGTLRCTPAMAAGIERTFWTVGELLEAAA